MNAKRMIELGVIDPVTLVTREGLLDEINIVRQSTRGTIFFFQAEDGIRDRNVTGVQTCALPILLADPSPVVRREILLSLAQVESQRAMDAIVSLAKQWDGEDRFYLEAVGIAARGRSEERRVGKECTSRWPRSHHQTCMRLWLTEV